uniref:Facilitated trehalose transporter Tret1-2 n=1 Tax=Lygus hesperus TaxID=30085 RepID=A0A0A9YXN9_LYGHE
MANNQHKGETEKWLPANGNSAQPETATEQCASIFDLRFDPNSKNSKHSSKKLYPQILACISAASFHFPVGIVVAFSAIVIPELEKQGSEIPATKDETAWFASLAVSVVPVGALFTGWIMETIGRLNTIRVAAIPYTIGWILIATASGLPQLFIGRFLTGFAIAMGPSPGIVYITEVARPDLRGSLICTGPSMTSFGMLVTYTLGWLLPWRTVAWIGIAFTFVPLGAMFLWAPESPSWLLSKGRREDALKAFQFLARGDPDQEALAERQIVILEKEISSKRKTGPQDPVIKRFVKGFGNPTGYKPLFILIFLFFFQQFAGIYITIFYAVTFFQQVNSGMDPYISTILIGLIRMLMGFLTSGLLRSYGRRTLCIISGLGMSILLGISGYYTYLIQIKELESSIVPVICLLLYMSLSVIGLMSIPWTMTAELFPVEMRGMAQGFIVSLAHVIMFSALLVYRSLPDLLGGAYGVQYLFGGMSLASVLFVYVFLPETHKKTLIEINNYFKHNTIYLGSAKRRQSTATPGLEMSSRTSVSPNPNV